MTDSLYLKETHKEADPAQLEHFSVSFSCEAGFWPFRKEGEWCKKKVALPLLLGCGFNIQGDSTDRMLEREMWNGGGRPLGLELLSLADSVAAYVCVVLVVVAAAAATTTTYDHDDNLNLGTPEAQPLEQQQRQTD